MNKPKTIQELLTDWGRLERQSPSQNETLKTKILAAFPAPQPSRPSVQHPRLPWFSLALAGCAVLLFLILPAIKSKPLLTAPMNYSDKSPLPSTAQAPSSQLQNNNLPTRALSGTLNSTENIAPDAAGGIYQPTPIFPNPAPANDNREFLKTSYSATIQTKRVQDQLVQIQTIIKGFGGRVDSSNSSPDSGFISFVIPASQFDSFRSQIKNLVNYRFYSEQQLAENLLPQKQDLETQQKNTTDDLNQIISQRDQLSKNHNSLVASLKSQISSLNNQLAGLQNSTSTDPGRYLQIQDLQNQKQKLQTKLDNENYNYSQQLNYYNSQIQDDQNNLTDLNNQTTNLLENVATVNGDITLQAIGNWAIFNAYCPPGYWVPGLLMLLALIYYWFYHRKTELMLP